MDLPDFSKDQKFIALREAMGIKPEDSVSYKNDHPNSTPEPELADNMRLETTITDQILLTFGEGHYRSVLKTWHISERIKAEQYLWDLRNPTPLIP